MNLISIPAFQDNYIWVLIENHGRCIIVDPGEAAPGSVLQVFQKGYLLNDRLLRPALVVVARHD